MSNQGKSKISKSNFKQIILDDYIEDIENYNMQDTHGPIQQ